MKFIKLLALILCLATLTACGKGKEIKNYRVHDDLVISFTEALGERRLVSENIETENDGRIITKAEYTYESEKADEDKENYLYYLFNSYSGATFLSESTVALNSRTADCSVRVTATSEGNRFTISIERVSLAVE